MLKVFPVLVAVFLMATALAETTHNHEHSCDAPCPAVCLGGSAGSYCENTGLSCAGEPLDTEKPAAACFIPASVPRLSEDEIFHPPVV